MKTEDVEWRHCKKFAGYEVGSNRAVRFKATGRIIPQRKDLWKPEQGFTVLLMRGANTFPAFVDEIFNDAFPEARSMAA